MTNSTTTRRRTALGRLAFVATLLVVACVAPQPGRDGSGESPDSSYAPSATSGPAASPITQVAERGGLKLVAEFDRLEVEAGGTVTVALSIANTRATDVVFDEPCDTQGMTVDVRAPAEPIGREWDGLAAAFKTYALETSSGSPMESSIRGPVPTVVRSEPCHATESEAEASGRRRSSRPARPTRPS